MPKDYLKNPPLADDEMMAAIDIGSNSFHLAIARLDHGEVRKVVSMSEKVQLAAGLDENNILGAAAEKRGLECLSRFVARLDSVPPERIRVVAKAHQVLGEVELAVGEPAGALHILAVLRHNVAKLALDAAVLPH